MSKKLKASLIGVPEKSNAFLKQFSKYLLYEKCTSVSSFTNTTNFDEKYEYLEFDNPLTYNREKYISRSLSGSYSLKKDDVNYFEYMKALSELYEKYQRDNVLMLKNKTVVYIGQLK